LLILDLEHAMSVSILPVTASKSILSGMAGPSATQRENTDFARMLSQREAEQAPVKAPERSPEKQAQKTPEDQREAEKASHAPEKPRERSVEERRLAQAGGKPAAKAADIGIDDVALAGVRHLKNETAGTAGTAGTADAAEDGKAVAGAEDKDKDDPVPVDWLAALQLPAQVPGEKEAVSGKRGGGDAGDDGAGDAGKGRARFGAGALDRAAQDVDQARLAAEDAAAQKQVLQGEADPLGNGSDASAAWQGGMAQAIEPGAAGSAAASGRGAAIDGAAALAGAAQAAPISGASAPAAPAAPAPTVHVPTPADSPEFPQALGAQISVLARDGIQQAELHLNPAEMGPISVQIDLQGSQAQVDFGADSAATRQIIENGLPELAAALREAGFTLSGGGVHQQARGPRDGGDGAGGQGGDGGGNGRGRGASGIGSAADEPSAAAQRIQARVSAGGVDLYV
jgi:flagellar hook-length control protein FliK